MAVGGGHLAAGADLSKHARILIAGCGYVGEATADLFHSAGWNVEGWVHSKESAARLSVKPYSIRVIDVSQRGEVAKRAGAFDAVIHCASSRGGDAEAYRQIYLNGARHLLETFPKAKILFTSSTSYSVYKQHQRLCAARRFVGNGRKRDKTTPGDQPDPFRSGKVNPRKRRDRSAARRDLRAATFGAVEQIPKRHGHH